MGTIVNVHEAKARLSALIAAAEHGEDVSIARAGKPAVKLVPVTPPVAAVRTFGTLPGLHVPDDFDAPLPDAELEAWE